MDLRSLLRRFREWLVRPASRPRTSAGADVQTLAVLRDAIQRKKQIIAFRGRGRRPLVFCPHALASGAGRWYVLAFVVVGERADDEDLQSPARWRWIPVTELSQVVQREGFWFSAPRESRPELRTVRIELDAA